MAPETLYEAARPAPRRRTRRAAEPRTTPSRLDIRRVVEKRAFAHSPMRTMRLPRTEVHEPPRAFLQLWGGSRVCARSLSPDASRPYARRVGCPSATDLCVASGRGALRRPHLSTTRLPRWSAMAG